MHMNVMHTASGRNETADAKSIDVAEVRTTSHHEKKRQHPPKQAMKGLEKAIRQEATCSCYSCEKLATLHTCRKAAARTTRSHVVRCTVACARSPRKTRHVSKRMRRKRLRNDFTAKTHLYCVPVRFTLRDSPTKPAPGKNTPRHKY